MTDRMFDANKTGRRLSGKDRYETAAAISGATYPKADTVILAYSMNYADALAGVPLAYKLNAPILLTNKDNIDRATLYEIKRLGAKKVKILGGEGAISQKVVVQELVDHGIKKENIERISGDSRFGTATAIAGEADRQPDKCFLRLRLQLRRRTFGQHGRCDKGRSDNLSSQKRKARCGHCQVPQKHKGQGQKRLCYRRRKRYFKRNDERSR